jgi:hypothetical protein
MTSDGSTSLGYLPTGLAAANGMYYTRTPDGQLLSEDTTTAYFGTYLFDGFGSVIGLASSSGTLESTYTYDPMGNTVVSYQSIQNAIGFHGQFVTAGDLTGGDPAYGSGGGVYNTGIAQGQSANLNAIYPQWTIDGVPGGPPTEKAGPGGGFACVPDIKLAANHTVLGMGYYQFYFNDCAIQIIDAVIVSPTVIAAGVVVGAIAAASGIGGFAAAALVAIPASDIAEMNGWGYVCKGRGAYLNVIVPPLVSWGSPVCNIFPRSWTDPLFP